VNVAESETGRPNQRRRTRKELLQAAARLLKGGRTPTLEEVAEEALVSRATAYRYFPNVEALIVEAPLDVAMPEPDAVFASDRSADALARILRVDSAVHAVVSANETPLRIMLAHALEQAAKGAEMPVRQNRRTPLIEAALKPARGRMDAKAYKRLKAALALVIGTEAMLVFKDVLQMSDAEAQEVKAWAFRALIDAAVR
jgi:AcrR family transcriptional regulator